ncbi:MAG: hypothetical protein D6730_09085 [Bacteroidetes bacterium]|nr:MAG: hypothetical protein D6730_09085 [Bacteroidota bacterium]
MLILFVVNLSMSPPYTRVPNEHFPDSMSMFEEKVKQNFIAAAQEQLTRDDKIIYRMEERGEREATQSNFEGPQVHLYSVKHWNREFFGRNPQRGMRVFDISGFNYDPDHDNFGLPNVTASVSNVKLYTPPQRPLQALFGFTSKKNKPYRVYRKKIKSNKNGVLVEDLEMELWLTTFSVNVTIVPDLKGPRIGLSAEDKQRVTYPAYWYKGSSNHPSDSLLDRIPLGKLKREINDYRYNNLHIVLKVIPDKSPWYIKTDSSQNEKPDIGIGAIYCDSIKVNTEKSENRISPNLHRGKAVPLLSSYLRPETDMSAKVDVMYEPPERRLENPNDTTFWNRAYYVDIFFNNIGSWKENLGLRKYADQVTFTFVMPILVKGSWDIRAPNEIIPDFEPPEAYNYQFSLANLIPDLGIPKIGKIIFLILAGFILLVVLGTFVAPVANFINRIVKLFTPSS